MRNDNEINELHKIYHGRILENGGTEVLTLKGPLNPRFNLKNHSPDGFMWGYRGSGPSQLALALCCDALDGDQTRALEVYQRFRDKVIANLDRDNNWSMSKGYILYAIEQCEKEG